MTISVVLGWSASFDDGAGALHLSTSDRSPAATIRLSGAPPSRGDGLMDRTTSFFESRGHRNQIARWRDSGGRLQIGATAQLESRSGGTGQVQNGSFEGHLRRHRTGAITLAGRTYRVRHRSRWRTDVDVDGQQVAVLRRRLLSRRNRPLARTRTPSVQTSAMTEVDQLAVVLAATVMGPPGRTGFWASVASEISP